jgi:hypothetical protein
MPPAGSSESPGQSTAPPASGPQGPDPFAGAVVMGAQDPEITCKPTTVTLSLDVDEALGGSGPVGEHIPAPVPTMHHVPLPEISLRPLDPSLPPPSTGQKAEGERFALASVGHAVAEANARGPGVAGAAGITNQQLVLLLAELSKAEEHSKKATEAQTSLKRDAAAIRTMPAVRAAATTYQDKYRAFEKTVRDTKPKVHGMKSAAAALASIQAAGKAKDASAEADKKQAEVDKVKKQAEAVLNVGVKAVEGFKSGGWMGAAAGAAGAVNDAAKEAIGAEAKSLASGMIAKLLKPDLAETEAAIAQARSKAAALTSESEAKALEAKLEDFNRAATELSNAQKDIEAAGTSLLEAEGGFAAALKSANLTGAIKAIRMRREMRQLHGVAMQAVNKHQDGLVTNETICSEAIGLYSHVINMACNAQKVADVTGTMAAASQNLGSTKRFRAYGRREQGACASDRTKLGDWLAGYDILADELTSVLAEIPK